jgi:glycosyltransferase involved in cell wall biosynthesis
MTELSILILHIPERYDFLKRLCGILDPQLEKHKASVECLVDDRRYVTKGKKRNDLMARAKGKYLCFIDDDDRISDNYIELIMYGIRQGVDCCSLRGIITEDGKNPAIFEHSIKYGIYRTVTDAAASEVKYERYPNHLNAIRSDIARTFGFTEKNHGEDTDYATAIHQAGLIKSEYYIPHILYYYDYRSQK